MGVFEGFTFAKPEDAAKLKVVLKKFNLTNIVRHKKKKHIMAALKFNERRQRDNESFDSLVADLNILVKDCGYQQDERMVRDLSKGHRNRSKLRSKPLQSKKARQRRRPSREYPESGKTSAMELSAAL